MKVETVVVGVILVVEVVVVLELFSFMVVEVLMSSALSSHLILLWLLLSLLGFCLQGISLKS